MTDRLITDQRITTLKWLEPSRTSPVLERTKQFLAKDDTQPLTERAVEARVGDVRQLWRVRLDISRAKGGTVDGAPELLRRLEEMNSRIKLEQFGFADSSLMGNVFFRKATHEYVGSVFFAGSLPAR